MPLKREGSIRGKKEIWMARFILGATLICAALSANDNIEVLKMSPAYYNENAIIKQIYSENGIIGPKSPLVLQVAEFPLGVSLPNSPQWLKGMRESGNGSAILVWVLGENNIQKRFYISIDDGTSFIENKAYFRDRYRKFIEAPELEKLDKFAITAILVNAYGEVIKSSKATKTIIVDHKKKSDGDYKALKKDLEMPFLLYNEPYGTFTKNQPILLDFYVFNADIGTDAYAVELYIDDVKEKDPLTEWAPYRIKMLPSGIHKFQIKLVDHSGKYMPEPFGPLINMISITD